MIIVYTVFKKLYHFYFCDNFVGHEPISIIFGKNVAKEIGNRPYAEPYVLVIDSLYVLCCWCSRKH